MALAQAGGCYEAVVSLLVVVSASGRMACSDPEADLTFKTLQVMHSQVNTKFL